MTTISTPQFLPADRAVEPVRLLDPEGRLVDGAAPLMSDDEVLTALRYMCLGRAFDARCLSLQRQGKLGTFAAVDGQEAAVMGSAMALDPARDWIVPQYREFAAMVRHGHPPERAVLYRQGHPEGGVMAPGVKVLQFQVSLAAQLPHAVGIAWGLRLKREPGVVVAYFGDGAASEGDFHEACNLAGVVQAPVVFLLQNNQWAISTPRSIQTAATDMAARAPGYGFPGVSVDGNDLLAVHRVTAEAVERALGGEGPTLVEAHTYRMGAHTTADDPTRYVDEGERETWSRRDPIDRVKKYLAARGRWDEAADAALTGEIAAEIQDMFDRAAALGPPEAGDIFEHVYAEPTPALRRQRRRMLGDR